MKVLLTGAGGFLGRYVVRAFKARGVEVVGLGRRPLYDDEVSWIQTDLLSDDDLTAVVSKAQATHLVHLAWYVKHGKFWTSPLNLRWVDVTVRLVEAFCVAGGQHVTITGTSAEYDWAYGYCREDTTPLRPHTFYGIAKDATRRLVEAVSAQHGVPLAWARIFMPYGAGESSERLIPSLIDALQGRRPLFAINALAYRDFLHASDVAEALVHLATSKAGGAYNVSSAEPTRLTDLVNVLAGLLGIDPSPIVDLYCERPGEPRLLVGENLKLKALGWRPGLSLVQGLERSLDREMP